MERFSTDVDVLLRPSHHRPGVSKNNYTCQYSAGRDPERDIAPTHLVTRAHDDEYLLVAFCWIRSSDSLRTSQPGEFHQLERGKSTLHPSAHSLTDTHLVEGKRAVIRHELLVDLQHSSGKLDKLVPLFESRYTRLDSLVSSDILDGVCHVRNRSFGRSVSGFRSCYSE